MAWVGRGTASREEEERVSTKEFTAMTFSLSRLAVSGRSQKKREKIGRKKEKI